MKILRLEYEDKRLGWKLEPVDFANLTLLVGVSGVGKTRILRSILAMKRIAEGAALRGVSWKIEFAATDGQTYSWQGEFEDSLSSSSRDVINDVFEIVEDEKSKPRLVHERLEVKGNIIVERDKKGILLRGKRTPKLSSYESALSTLREENDVSNAHGSFRRIIYSDQTRSVDTAESVHLLDFAKLTKKYTSLEDIRESILPTLIKLALCYEHLPDIFSQILDRFVSIFPYVENVKIEPAKEEDVPMILREIRFLYIKERGVEQWIHQRDISSGMLRTITHLAEIFLSPEGTVILIDEFENSLGVNCINVVTEDLLNESRNIQFIITSHHPYVINNIGFEYWKIVSRHGSSVTTRNASDYHLGKSTHEAFLQLINLSDYKEGIEIG